MNSVVSKPYENLGSHPVVPTSNAVIYIMREGDAAALCDIQLWHMLRIAQNFADASCRPVPDVKDDPTFQRHCSCLGPL